MYCEKFNLFSSIQACLNSSEMLYCFSDNLNATILLLILKFYNLPFNIKVTLSIIRSFSLRVHKGVYTYSIYFKENSTFYLTTATRLTKKLLSDLI